MSVQDYASLEPRLARLITGLALVFLPVLGDAPRASAQARDTLEAA